MKLLHYYITTMTIDPCTPLQTMNNVLMTNSICKFLNVKPSCYVFMNQWGMVWTQDELTDVG